MQLSDAIFELDALAGVDVTSLAHDSRRVQPGALFFALKGTTSDGADFAGTAIAQGAVAVVAERPAPEGISVPWVVVHDAAATLARACRVFYGRNGKMQYAGVTGTNGKTTLTYIIEAIWRQAGHAVGVLGTIEHRLGEKRWDTGHTTPDAIALCERLQEMEQLGATWAVMEVSSHALDQKRADALRFSAVGFTNLTPDHLDYHGTMETYFDAKARLFSELMQDGGACVINVDAGSGPEMTRKVHKRARLITVSCNGPADVRVVRSQLTREGTHLWLETIAGAFEVQSPLLGQFNVENVAVAVGMALGCGLSPDVITQAIASFKGVPGRLESIRAADGRLGFVDYAHTPDALERVLQTLQGLPHDRIICVFGCGGDRDRSKRPLMGSAVARLADMAIVTSDNPRTEDPRAIIDEIIPGFKGKRHDVIADRRQAIQAAAEAAGANDIVLIAGKGHETYQIIGTTKAHFDDREELRAAFGAPGGDRK